jgi:hypothetical protein
MKRSQATIPEHVVIKLQNMNCGMWQNEMSKTTIARAIWEGKAIMGTA